MDSDSNMGHADVAPTNPLVPNKSTSSVRPHSNSTLRFAIRRAKQRMDRKKDIDESLRKSRSYILKSLSRCTGARKSISRYTYTGVRLKKESSVHHIVQMASDGKYEDEETERLFNKRRLKSWKSLPRWPLGIFIVFITLEFVEIFSENSENRKTKWEEYRQADGGILRDTVSITFLSAIAIAPWIRGGTHERMQWLACFAMLVVFFVHGISGSYTDKDSKDDKLFISNITLHAWVCSMILYGVVFLMDRQYVWGMSVSAFVCFSVPALIRLGIRGGTPHLVISYTFRIILFGCLMLLIAMTAQSMDQSLRNEFAANIVSKMEWYGKMKAKESNKRAQERLDSLWKSVQESSMIFHEKDLKLEIELAQGHFAIVYLASHRHRKSKFVVKVSKNKDEVSDLRSLLTMIGMKPHRNVLRMLGITKVCGRFATVSPHCEKGSLDMLHRKIDLARPEIIVKIALDLFNGLNHLHSHGVVHRDVACRNILLDDDGVVVIADLGLARQMHLDVTNEFQYISIGYLNTAWAWSAPESLDKAEFNGLTDVYMAGVCLWEIVTKGGKPHNYDLLTNEQRKDVEKKIIESENVVLEVPETSGLFMRDLIRWCLSPNPLDRPTGAEMLEELSQELFFGIKMESKSNINPIREVEKPHSIARRNDDIKHVSHSIREYDTNSGNDTDLTKGSELASPVRVGSEEVVQAPLYSVATKLLSPSSFNSGNWSSESKAVVQHHGVHHAPTTQVEMETFTLEHKNSFSSKFQRVHALSTCANGANHDDIRPSPGSSSNTADRRFHNASILDRNRSNSAPEDTTSKPRPKYRRRQRPSIVATGSSGSNTKGKITPRIKSKQKEESLLKKHYIEKYSTKKIKRCTQSHAITNERLDWDNSKHPCTSATTSNSRVSSNNVLSTISAE